MGFDPQQSHFTAHAFNATVLASNASPTAFYNEKDDCGHSAEAVLEGEDTGSRKTSIKVLVTEVVGWAWVQRHFQKGIRRSRCAPSCSLRCSQQERSSKPGAQQTLR